MVVATPCLRLPNDVVTPCRSPWLGTTSSRIYRTRSLEFKPLPLKQKLPSIRRACSASFDTFSDEEFSKKINDLALKFQLDHHHDERDHDLGHDHFDFSRESKFRVNDHRLETSSSPSDEETLVSIEMKANSVDLPLSLRMIKKKKMQLQEGIVDLGETAYCSFKKAFSSMVFIIRELHSFSLQMRELLYFEDLQGILARVQGEMQASFVWLFQQVFSHTPTLMVSVMILLANFTVHSMADAVTIPSIYPSLVTVEESGVAAFDISSYDNSVSRTIGGVKEVSIGGNNGGGSGVKPVGSGMDGDGWANRGLTLPRPVVPDGGASVSGREEEEEAVLWDEMVEEASRDEALDSETVQDFVSPVTVRIDDDVSYYEDYFKTELVYQSGLAKEPSNVLLLANYAQFLYLVAHDFDRAEEYFKRAISVEPKDAEAHSKYATFLWQVRKDLWAAEETFLEAISADPSNSFYAANYAHFLWSTGGEDTCYPLDDTVEA